MNNKLTLFAVAVILMFSVLGCGLFGGSRKADSSSPDKEKTTTDKVVDTTVGRSKIGVPECDEVMDLIEIELNNPDDNFIVKAGKATFLNRIKDGIRESYEKNPEDTAELAKSCKEFKTQFEKFKAEEESKKK